MDNQPRLQKRPLFRLTSGLFACLLASCGGGSHGMLPHPGGVAPQRSRIKVTVNVPSPASLTTRGHRVGLARKFNYVSYSSAGLGINFVKHGGSFGDKATPQYAENISLSSANCTVTTSPARTCTFTIPIDTGYWDIQATLWDRAPDGSNTFSGANALSQSVVSNQAIVSAQTNSIGFTFNPIVNAVVLSLATSAMPAGTSATTSLNVDLTDAAGNHIIGTDALLGENGDALTLNLNVYDAPCTGISPRCTSQTSTTLSTTSLTAPPTGAITVTPGTNSIYTYFRPTQTGDSVSGSTAGVALAYTSIGSNYDAGALASVSKALAGTDGAVYLFGSDGTNGKMEIITNVRSSDGHTTSSRSEIGTPDNLCATDATVGRDGNVWFVETDCAAPADLRLAYVTAGSHNTGDFDVDGAGGGASASIASDSNGNLWFTAPGNGALYEASANTGNPGLSQPQYLVPSPSAPSNVAAQPDIAPGGLTAGTYDIEYTYATASGETIPGPSSEGTLADNQDLLADCPADQRGATSYNVYVQYNGGGFAQQLANQALASCSQVVVSSYNSSGSAPPAINTMTKPQAIAYGPDGNLWIVDAKSNDIAEMSTAGVLGQLIAATAPLSITALDSSTMVFSDSTAGICTLATASGSPACSALTSGAALSPGIVVGADGNIYYPEYYLGASTIGSKKYGSLGTTTDVTTGFSPGFVPVGLAADANGHLWFASNYNSSQTQASEMQIP